MDSSIISAKWRSSIQTWCPWGSGSVTIHYRGRPFENRLYTDSEKSNVDRAVTFAELQGVRAQILIPHIVSSNGVIAPHSAFMRSRNGMAFLGPAADGVVLQPGQAAAFATGDCATVVGWSRASRVAIAAHAGRKSLFGDFLDSQHAPDQSIVARMIRSFPVRERGDLVLSVSLAISGRHFEHRPDHPEWGDSNRRMIDMVVDRYGKQCFHDLATGSLSLLELIKAQCALCGVDRANVTHDGIDTYSQRLVKPDGSEGDFAFNSCRRGDRVSRNLVLVSVS